MQAQISAGYLPGIFAMGSPCSEMVSGFGTCRGSPQGNPGYQQDIQGISLGHAGPDICRIPAGYLRHGFTLALRWSVDSELAGTQNRAAGYQKDIQGISQGHAGPDICRIPAGYLRHGFTLLGAGQWIRNLPGITTGHPDISKISEGYLWVMQAQISAGYLPGIFAICSLAQILLGGINLIPYRC